MGLLDGVMGGGIGGLIPGMEMLDIVSKALDLAKNLFDKGDTKGTQETLQLLNDVLSKFTNQQQAGQATEPQPFTNPQTAPWAGGGASIDIDITISNSQPVSYGTLPIVDGSPQGDQNLSNLASSRIDGSDASKSRTLAPGSNEWMTVMSAMQQNPNVRYNADTQRFSMKMSDGSDRDVCSLAEAQNVLQNNGGLNRSNPLGAQALKTFLNQEVNDAANSPLGSLQSDLAKAANGNVSADDLSKLIDELKKKLKLLEQAQQMMSPGAMDLSVRVSA